VHEIILPKDTTDPKEMREKSQRKGKIIRTVTIDGKESKSEVDFLV